MRQVTKINEEGSREGRAFVRATRIDEMPAVPLATLLVGVVLMVRARRFPHLPRQCTPATVHPQPAPTAHPRPALLQYPQHTVPTARAHSIPTARAALRDRTSVAPATHSLRGCC